MDRSVPVLMYHEVAPRPRPEFVRYTVTPQAFAWQMRWLARTGHTSVSLQRLHAARTTGARLPRRPFVVTFDDGFAGSARHAPPILQRHGFRATFFVVAGLVGGSSEWLRDEVGAELPLMDRPGIRRLQAAGFEIGSHTVSHPRLAELQPDRCREELLGARQLLEPMLGRSVRHLSFPFGSQNRSVQRMARDCGYLTACTTIEGRSGDEGLFELRRIPVYGDESRLDFLSRVLTAEPFRPMVRRRWRRWRRRLAGQG